ncbi:MAG: calcium-binding protein [Pseudomonadota bacterium]
MAPALNPADFDELIIGTSGNDVLLLPLDQEDSVLFRGRGGNDVFRGGEGDDGFEGGGGNDTFWVSTGNDRFVGGGGINTYNASALNEFATGRFEFGFGGQIKKGNNAGTDTIGNFTLNPNGSIASIMPIQVIVAPGGRDDNLVDLSASGAQNGVAFANVDLKSNSIEVVDTIGGGSFTVTAQNFTDITGTNLDDDLRGDNQANEIRGEQGNDVIRGRGGADELFGNGGNDDLRGGGGNDVLRGGGGNDTLNGGNGNDDARGGNGDDVFIGSSGDDAFQGNGGFDTADYSNLGAPISFNQGGRIEKGVGGALGLDQLGTFDPFSFVEKVIGDPTQLNTVDNSGGFNISVVVDLVGGADGPFVTATVEVPFQIGGTAFPVGTNFTVEIENFTNIVGTGFADDLMGDGDANEIIGGAGEDLLKGRGGNDILAGGLDADEIRPGGGLDTVVLTDQFSTDDVFGFNVTDDMLLISIAGVSGVAQIENGSDLDIVVDDGGIADGAVLATLVNRGGQAGNVDVDFGDFPLVA